MGGKIPSRSLMSLIMIRGVPINRLYSHPATDNVCTGTKYSNPTSRIGYYSLLQAVQHLWKKRHIVPIIGSFPSRGASLKEKKEESNNILNCKRLGHLKPDYPDPQNEKSKKDIFKQESHANIRRS
ncbi:hypothetical protein MTR_4g055650 [Medicago truncatula]|uniref:Uncharacterized protein n=1 Tax=Medicago truncatula TaxID=3880 RepID=G7JM52_MEDTR|nr:hypothetical protein MTR_4g055650 [Medicago truncatula]